MKLFSRFRYYAASIITLLTRFERPFQILAIFLGFPGSLPAQIRLKQSQLRFTVREAMDVWVIKETCVDNDYLAKKDFQPDWNVVDIGAGLGDFTVFAAVNCPRGRVFAYEPLDSSYALMGENLMLNGLANVKIFQEATSAAAGTMTAVSKENAAVSTRFVSGPTRQSQPQSEIPVVTLEQVLDRLPDGICHLMKIDCEGCEFDLLLNSPPALLTRIERLAIETHNGYSSKTTQYLASYLQQQGFEVRLVSNPVHDYLGFLYAERVN